MERNLETITTLADSAGTYTRDQVSLFPFSQASMRAKASTWAFVMAISFLPKKLHLFLRPTRSCRVKAEAASPPSKTCPLNLQPESHGCLGPGEAHGPTVGLCHSLGAQVAEQASNSKSQLWAILEGTNSLKGDLPRIQAGMGSWPGAPFTEQWAVPVTSSACWCVRPGHLWLPQYLALYDSNPSAFPFMTPLFHRPPN